MRKINNRITDCGADPRITATAFRLYATYAKTEDRRIDTLRCVRFMEWFKLSDKEMADAMANLEEFGYITQVPMGDDTYYQLH